ncbi:MAG: galactose mutarotase [Erysipelotrichaceae bacterium]|nr:galactose mutarotase [Erysipelotrichaceae bacterium]
MKDFGIYNNKKIDLIEIENNNFILQATNYGATIVSLYLKKKKIDVIQGFDNVDGYINDVPYMGGSIGRVCNRIGKGKFHLNNNDYFVSVNNGPNSLHGGNYGFDKQIWNYSIDNNKIVFTYLSKDKEEGYPGNLKVKVIYELIDNGFIFEYEGTSDKDTLFSMTNHAFFNFNGPTSLSALDHKIQTDAKYVAKVDSDGLTLDDIFDVKNTPFDFSQYKSLGKDIDNDYKQLINGSGYDHHFLVDGDGFRKMVSCNANGIIMDVYSDLPGFHLYSGNFLDGKAIGKQGGSFPRRSAVCFETQYYPNAINYDSQKKPILKANEYMKHISKFIFEVEEN